MSGIEKFTLGGNPGHRGPLHIGLVNNMPDAALRATELQFAKLLKHASAAPGAQALDVELHLFSMGEIARGEVALSRMQGFYADAATLPGAGLDGLIVTGAEAGAGDLQGEPYWDALTRLIDWAEIGTVSTYFSASAAHAAVLHLDNIAPRRLPRKLSGVFSAEPAGEGSSLLTGAAPFAQVPHCRRDDVSEGELAAYGYRIVRRLAGGGADLFTRKAYSLFVFAQGHPEYDGAMLGREYLRDIGRALRGEGEAPAIPEHYFDRLTEIRLRELAEDGVTDPERYSVLVTGAVPLVSWRGHTVRLFANWLATIAAEKARRAALRAPAERKRA